MNVHNPSYITKARQNEIDSTIDHILLQIGKTYPENGLEDIVESFDNINACEYDFKEDSNRISGAIAYVNIDGKTTPRIYINRALAPAVKTFTLAHEFGHYILHTGESKHRFRLDFNRAYSDEDKRAETEANYFAASLLMPKNKFLELLRIGCNEQQLARYFGVSEAAVRVRASWISQN